ncbi:Uncharacterized protein dnm_077450 [Desulfonema magnum]|uniref:Uncharacterized protein n=1 Tax=Desulfonema magnum TaxID=45655 RepID=A0A975BUQ0_9BACT|nr:Uncharacterized protein dnm_077450 [Desulfonema magnum]
MKPPFQHFEIADIGMKQTGGNNLLSDQISSDGFRPPRF